MNPRHRPFPSRPFATGLTRRAALHRLAGGTLAVATGLALDPTSARAQETPNPIVPTGPVAPVLDETPSPLPDFLLRWEAAWAARDSTAFAALFTPDGIYEDLAFESVNRGPDEIVQFLDVTFAAIPDVAITSLGGFRGDDWAAAEWVFSGTLVAPLGPIPGNGRSFSVRGSSMFELDGDLIRRESDHYNLATMLRQLALLPGPEGAAAATPAP